MQNRRSVMSRFAALALLLLGIPGALAGAVRPQAAAGASRLFVANVDSDTVTEYVSPSTKPITIRKGINAPEALALDASGDLLVANCGEPCGGRGRGEVTEYAPPYTGTPITIVVGVDVPEAVALDASGDLFVANSSTITEYRPPYTAAPAATIGNGWGASHALVITKSSNLLVANCDLGCMEGHDPGTVTVFTPPYAGTAATIVNGIKYPEALALDSSADLFVENARTVMEYTPPYTGTPTTVSTGEIGGGIALDGKDNLFIAKCISSCAANRRDAVLLYAPPYTSAPRIIRKCIRDPLAITLDAVGNLFVAEDGSECGGRGTGEVTEYAPPYTGAPTTISNGVNHPVALLVTR